MLVFNTLENILKVFLKTIDRLERFQEKKEAAISRKGLKIQELKTKREADQKEADRAKVIAEKLRSLLDE